MKPNTNSFGNKLKVLFPITNVFFLTLLFQNCGQNAFQARLPSSIEQASNDQLDLSSEHADDNELAAMDATNLICTAPNPGKNIYFVAMNGNDDINNPGTLGKPFRTIARGSKAMASGDTLCIRAGTYNEGMYHGLGKFEFRNGTPSAYTRYAAYPGEEKKVIIKNPKTDLKSPHVVYFSDNAAYIELRGLVFDGINNVRGPGIRGIPFIPGYGIKGIRNSRIIGNIIRNSGMGLGGGQNSAIIGNLIYNMSDYGIYTGSGDNGLVEGNIFRDCGGFGIHHYESSATGKFMNNWVFRTNIIYRSGRGYDHSLTGDKIRTASAVLISSGRNHKFYNNIVYDSHGGISVGFGAIDTLIANNTVYKNDNIGINISGSYGGSLRTRAVNNISYGNGGAALTNSGTGSTLQPNLTVDPKFLNPVARDFRLRAGSPAIDMGVTLKEVPKDFLGVARPRGKDYDLGAYEF